MRESGAAAECKRSHTWVLIKGELNKLNGVSEQLRLLFFFFLFNLMKPFNLILSQPGAQDLH